MRHEAAGSFLANGTGYGVAAFFLCEDGRYDVFWAGVCYQMMAVWGSFHILLFAELLFDILSNKR